MTIIEAEKQYELDKEMLEEKFESKKFKLQIFGGILAAILIITGLVLFIVGAHKPPKISEYTGDVMENNFVENIVGGICFGYGLLIALLVMFSGKITGVNYLPANKNLYMNYIRCSDMDDCDKDFYKQKLEEIRWAELRHAISRAGGAIMFSNIIKD